MEGTERGLVDDLEERQVLDVPRQGGVARISVFFPPSWGDLERWSLAAGPGCSRVSMESQHIHQCRSLYLGLNAKVFQLSVF